MKKLIISEIEKKINKTTDEWIGQCYYIATLFELHKIIDGIAVYGLWTGNIHPKSMFAGNLVSRHGWVRKKDDTIVDPTRWVFENANPYIYVGENDFYDEGAQSLRKITPPPRFDPTEKRVEINFSDERLEKHFKLMCQTKEFDIMQIFWLANQSPSDHGRQKNKTYKLLSKLGFKAFIPIDFFKM
ncbi:MAG: hypothetical protein KJI71_01250 [Patescibacteria group bacterium]|nr:hypothetical protein [Patescibacteria group bacterium]